MKPFVTLVCDTGGDWIAIYKHGELIAENHSLPAGDVLDAVGVRYDTRWVDMSDGFSLPYDLNELGDEA